MAVERFAAIDIGTNTILLLIAELAGNGTFAVLEDRAEITRLGENVDRSRAISPAAEERSLRVLRAYVARCKYLAVRDIVAVGTSALRDARNAAGFKERLRRELGLDLRVLSAEEEAAYSYLAVERGLVLGPGDVLVVDVGGGSTELIWGQDRRLFRWASLDLGAVRLTERYFAGDPPTDDECARLGEAIDREIRALIEAWGVPATIRVMVGIAGTFTTLAAVQRGLRVYTHSEVHGARLSDAEVARQIRLYRGSPLAARRKIAGLEPGRADVILAGALLIGRIMALFGIGEAVVSDQGIRYGLLYERL
jgi:exopolyphosphatase / guanosine-5'-triphosphate,3'-diphosphate pyrophosphatase